MHVLNPEERNPVDWFYLAKFTPDGEVREGWNYTAFQQWYWENVPKTSTRNCHTATHR